MRHRALAYRYAKTLLKADPSGSFEPGVILLKEVLEKPEVAEALGDPRISAACKVAALDKAFGSQWQKPLRDFVQLIARKSRLALLADIASAYLELLTQARGIHRGQIISAIPLTPEQLKRIQSKFASAAGAGQSFIFEQIVDPRLIGGFKIRIGDRVYDWSLRAQLQSLHQKFLTLAG